MADLHLPTPAQAAEIFETLLGRKVVAKPGKKLPIKPIAKLAVAGYKVPTTGALGAGVVFDIPLAVYASAALSMIPASAVASGAKSGVLPTNLEENLGEIFNICTQLLVTEDDATAILDGTYSNVKNIPDELVKAINGATEKIEVTIEIEGYGPGLATFHVF
ncbi:MAG: hypothetical protein KC933_01325 [Myxococcales bacterium]|nr:hypothetical protein [Myxococcales bacterium]